MHILMSLQKKICRGATLFTIDSVWCNEICCPSAVPVHIPTHHPPRVVGGSLVELKLILYFSYLM
jgi:hypothetical protein